uniref:Uncharacterized protein n=1 Tax=Anguilla anguilla TaxID=7936 RepID=A0A0E9UAV6_ANGAN
MTPLLFLLPSPNYTAQMDAVLPNKNK